MNDKKNSKSFSKRKSTYAPIILSTLSIICQHPKQLNPYIVQTMRRLPLNPTSEPALPNSSTSPTTTALSNKKMKKTNLKRRD